MDIDGRLEQVAVIGAAGKMGCGISVLLAHAMARLKIHPERRGKSYRLTLIDVRPEGLKDLLGYVETQSARLAHRDIEPLRSLYQGREGVTGDEQIARTFVAETLSVIRTATDPRQARGSRLVFEAVPETESLKVETLRQLKGACPDDAVFLSNTSSIPIQFLDREAGLDGRIIGFHFYNPPVVQELVEVIPARTTRPECAELAREIGRRLGKRLVPSRDIAGFIGNGHFIRDALHAVGEVERLGDRFDEPHAIYALNRVSQEGLLRPMGVFQLMDYVGIDVVASILRVMTRHAGGETFHADLIDRLVSENVLGGQRADGSQRDGFFRYEGRRPVAVYTPDREEYVSLRALDQVDRALGPLAEVEWKALRGDPDRARVLGDHFAQLASLHTLGARLTMAYLHASRRVGEKLLSDGVAETSEGVNTVLTSGFQHLYGPFNDYGHPSTSRSAAAGAGSGIGT
jgi:3-hydroxyacyl-CoA dehydrogenase